VLALPNLDRQETRQSLGGGEECFHLSFRKRAAGSISLKCFLQQILNIVKLTNWRCDPEKLLITRFSGLLLGKFHSGRL